MRTKIKDLCAEKERERRERHCAGSSRSVSLFSFEVRKKRKEVIFLFRRHQTPHFSPLRSKETKEREAVYFRSFSSCSLFLLFLIRHVHFLVEASDGGHHLRRWVRTESSRTRRRKEQEEAIWPRRERKKNVDRPVYGLLTSLLFPLSPLPTFPPTSHRRYRLGRKIGSGSFGDIYLGKVVVLKKSRKSRRSTTTASGENEKKTWLLCSLSSFSRLLTPLYLIFLNFRAVS